MLRKVGISLTDFGCIYKKFFKALKFELEFSTTLNQNYRLTGNPRLALIVL